MIGGGGCAMGQIDEIRSPVGQKDDLAVSAVGKETLPASAGPMGQIDDRGCSLGQINRGKEEGIRKGRLQKKDRKRWQLQVVR